MRVDVVLPHGHEEKTALDDGEHTEIQHDGNVLVRVTQVSRSHVRVELWPDMLARPRREAVRFVR